MPKLLLSIYLVLIASSVTYLAVRPASDWHPPVDPYHGLTTEVDRHLSDALTAQYKQMIADLTTQIQTAEATKQYDLDLYYNRAYNEFRLGELKEAFEDYQKVVAGDPNNETAWANLGDLRVQMGDVNGAEHYYQQYVAVYKDEISYDKLYNYYLTYRKADRSDRIEPLLKQAVIDVPESLSLLLNLADWEMQLKNYSAALDDYRQANLRKPNDPQIQADLQKAIQLAGTK